MAGFREGQNPDPGADQNGFVHGPRYEGGERITRIDFSYWPFGQRVSLNKVVATAAGIGTVGGLAAVIIPFPGL